MSRLSSITRRLGKASPGLALAAILGLSAVHPMTARADDAVAAAPAATDATATSTAAAAPAPAAAPTPADSSAAPQQPAPTAHIEGFRSAHFGMTQPEVRHAIATDFGVKASAIKTATDEIQKTAIIQLNVPDVISGGGTASVAYVFGYKSKRLMQIHLVWSHDSDPHLTQEQLLTNGQWLQNYFATAGYQVLGTGIVTKDGVIMFRGRDADGHMTALMLHGTMTEGKTKQQANLVLTGPLVLDYVEDPTKLDIFQLPSGKF